jgi:hypothetical protein
MSNTPHSFAQASAGLSDFRTFFDDSAERCRAACSYRFASSDKIESQIAEAEAGNDLSHLRTDFSDATAVRVVRARAVWRYAYFRRPKLSTHRRDAKCYCATVKR